MLKLIHGSRLQPAGARNIRLRRSAKDGGVVHDPSNTWVDISESAPFIDLTGTPGILVYSPNEVSDDHQYPVKSLPDGFTFPWFGYDVSQLAWTANGVISFSSVVVDWGSTGANEGPLPVPGDVTFAPFWDDLDAGTVGQVLVGCTTVDGRRCLIVQWAHMQFYKTLDSDLNFEVLLFEDGSFEFRYGVMSAPDADRANGSQATIGWQRESRFGSNFSFNTAIDRGLSNRAWRFIIDPGPYLTPIPEGGFSVEEVTSSAPFYSIVGSGHEDSDEDPWLAKINFPDNFTFPWFGERQTACAAWREGYLTFDLQAPSLGSQNSLIPTMKLNSSVLAPYWDANAQKGPYGIMHQLVEEHGVRALIIEWPNFGMYAEGYFQVVLFEDGRFDFRYGPMGNKARSMGQATTIGWQRDSYFGYSFTWETGVVGGLANRSWRYTPPGSI